MPEKCPNCGQRFMPEPGFYYGAMFLSYIVSAFFFLGLGALFVWVFGWPINTAFALIIAIGVITFIPFLRLSRSLWIHLMVPYDTTVTQSSNFTKFDHHEN